MPDSPELELLNIALESNIKAIWFAFGNEIDRWVNFVRDHDRKNGKKTIVFVQISSVELTLVAIHDWKVDVIVAQGFFPIFAATFTFYLIIPQVLNPGGMAPLLLHLSPILSPLSPLYYQMILHPLSLPEAYLRVPTLRQFSHWVFPG
jgi:hypothetical protein